MKTSAWLTLLFLLLSAAWLSAQRITTRLLEGSFITINGKATGLDFSFRQEAKNFIKDSMCILVTRKENTITLSENRIDIAVRSFASTNRMALRDFCELVQADQHPFLMVQLGCVELPEAPEAGNKLIFIAHVTITITGVENNYAIAVEASSQGEHVEISGAKRINIKSFGLSPPRKLFGLIRVSEWIDIGFRIHLAVRTEKE